MSWPICLLLCLFGAELSNSQKLRNYNFDSAGQSAQLAKGKREFDSIENYVSRSRLPQHGECWKAALDNLRGSCSQLTEEVQSRLAIAFASCFLDMMGLPNVACAPSDNVKNCIKALSEQGVHSFRDFFLHTMDMCHYIQSELWHLETDRAINTLQVAAIEMGETVNEQKITANAILSTQQEAQKVQEDMMKENTVLFQTFSKLKDSIEDFSHTATEHRTIFMEIFQKLSRMQELVTWIQGEMSLMDFIGFYMMAILFSYFSTTPARTQQARVWLVFSLALCVTLERYMSGYLTEQHASPDVILEKVWFIRRVYAAASIGFLMYAAVNYCDYNELNNTILGEIRRGMDGFREEMLELRDPTYIPETDASSTSSDDDAAGNDSDESFNGFRTTTRRIVMNNSTRRYSLRSQGLVDEIGDYYSEDEEDGMRRKQMISKTWACSSFSSRFNK